ncbi:pyridoxamine 5'-phosphate oxidase family protein [Atopobium sp. oral taxon 810]|uniref:pyridoxamine 5'-phosphate oxidase family protein n=1 Tax=Atopobium sp. oral taxon 810 TaxID=712158 RepID=UPI001E580893|nr:pyridoxamine 5'-phosphate oxidase family protein [Atopobium sp. oral taxon 810]
MQANDLLKMLRDMRDVCFATVDEKNLPQIRVIDIMLVEDGRIYFCTARGKDFYAQLLRRP